MADESAAAPVGLDLDALKELLAKVGDDASLLGEALQFRCDFEDLSLDGQALIVAAVNALPALLDLVSRQEAEIVRLRIHLGQIGDRCTAVLEGSASMLDGFAGGTAEDAPAVRSLLPREPKT